MTIQLKEYLDETGHSPFTSWFRCLNSQAATKVVTALYRLKQGNFSNVEGVVEKVGGAYRRPAKASTPGQATLAGL